MSAVNSGPAHPGSQVGILTDPFRDNVAGPLQGLLRIFDSEFLVDIRIGSSYIFDGFLFDRSIRLLGHKKICQSFKALFPGRGRSGRPFGPEGLIKIVDGNLGLGLQDLRAVHTERAEDDGIEEVHDNGGDQYDPCVVKRRGFFCFHFDFFYHFLFCITIFFKNIYMW